MMQDRRLRQGERPNWRIMLVWLALCAILALVSLGRITRGEFPDPDDALRLVQVRDLLAGQGWFDLHQYRINPAAGTAMHWSRLVDIPLVLVIGLLTPLLGAASAETAALVAVPLLTLGAIVFVIGRLTWRLFDLQTATYSCLAIGLMAPLVFQLQPMRIDHHGWQIFAVALALAALAGRQAFRGGLLAGAAMALGLSISIELLPLAAAFGGVLALRWLRDRSERWWLVGYLQALALTLALTFLATRGLGDLAPYCDAIAPAHLGLFLIIAIATGLAAAGPAVPRAMVIVLLAGAGAAGLAFFAMSAPQCLASPFAALDPLVRDYWYANVAEGRPIWVQDPALALPSLVQLLAGLAATLALMLRSRDWLRHWWTDYALLLVASILLSLLVWRSAAFAALIASIPLGWLAGRMLMRLRGAEGALHKLGLALLLALVLMPQAPIILGRTVWASEGDGETIRVANSGCAIRDQAKRLNRLAPARFFAPLDIGPAILVESRHAVVATGHHRAEAAMRDVIAAFTGSAADAEKLVRAHGADYVVLCSDLAEPRLFAAKHPQGFAAQLLAGKQPAWLEPVAIDAPAEFRLWRVKPVITTLAATPE